MIIRCERCSTMYELDESLLAPSGSPVQCTKCQHVFTAVPPRSAGRTLAGVPAAPEAASAPAPQGAPGDGRGFAASTDREPSSPQASPARSAPAAREPAARAARPGQPAVYRPPTTAAAAPVRAPVLKRDTVGTFEARLRWSARWRWLAPALAVGVVALVAAGWLLLSRASRPAPSDPRAEALALIALDDGVSLDEAAQKLADARARSKKDDGASADRALALVLRAAGVADERDSLAARLALTSEERERLRREAPPGAAEGDGPGAAAAALEREVRAREEQLRALSAAATDQLRAAQGAGDRGPEVVRAAAALHALRGEREPLEKLLRAAKEGRRDPWLDLADGWLDARDPDRTVRERALVKLGALAAAHPDLLRGRYLLARAEISLGRRAEARTTVDGILAANRRHEGARRLRDDLAPPTAPPPAATTPPPATAAPAPAATPAPMAGEQAAPAPRRRKAVPQAVPGASSPAGPGADVAAPPHSPGAPEGAADAPDAPLPGTAPASPGSPPADRAFPTEPPPGAGSAGPRPAWPRVEPPPDPGSQGG